MTSTSYAGAATAILILAVLVGGAVSLHEARRREIGSASVFKFLVFAAPLSTLTARAGYAAASRTSFDLATGFSSGWSGNVLLFGAGAGCVLAALLVSRLDRVSLPLLLDTLAPGAALSVALGKLASFFNGTCFGQAFNSDSFRFFPLAVYVESIRSWLAAVFAYEAVYMLAVFFALLLLRDGMKRPGDLSAWFAFLLGCGWVALESMRADNLYVWFVKVNQAVAILLALGILIFFSVRAVASRYFRAWDLVGWLGALLCVAVSFAAEFFMGAETAVRNTVAIAVSMALLIVIAALTYGSIREISYRRNKLFADGPG